MTTESQDQDKRAKSFRISVYSSEGGTLKPVSKSMDGSNGIHIFVSSFKSN